MRKSFFLALLIIVAPSATAAAEQETGPVLSGEVLIEIQNDWAYRSDDRANRNNDLYATIEPSMTVRLGPSWSVFAHAVLEPVTPPDQFENRVFGDHGLLLEDLYIEYASGAFDARVGKQNVGFGVAWDLTPGVYGTDFAEDGYETTERIGLIGGWTINAAAAGEHRLSAGTFFLDTTVLSQSTFKGRGDTRKQDGGVSNTEDFSSYIVVLNGGKVAGLGNLAYHASYMHQAKGEGDAAAEDSVALALYTSIELGNGIIFAPLVEYVHQDNPGGAADQERDFLTLAGQVERNGFNVALAWTRRQTSNSTTDDDYQLQVSAGYAFDFGLTIDIGWKVAEETDVKTRTLGALAAYTITF